MSRLIRRNGGFLLQRFIDLDIAFQHFGQKFRQLDNHGQQRTVTGAANREPAFLGLTVLHIGDGEQAWIMKYRGGQIETDTMLARVCIRLNLVLLELKWPCVQRSLSHTML